MMKQYVSRVWRAGVFTPGQCPEVSAYRREALEDVEAEVARDFSLPPTAFIPQGEGATIAFTPRFRGAITGEIVRLS